MASMIKVNMNERGIQEKEFVITTPKINNIFSCKQFGVVQFTGDLISSDACLVMHVTHL